MKKVKLTFPYEGWPIKRQFPGTETRWLDYQFIINPPGDSDVNFDYWFIFNFPLQEENSFCRKNSVVLITGEPDTIEPYSNEYVKQFDFIITSQIRLKHKNKFYLPQGLPWFVDKSFDDLLAANEVLKTKNLSIITSTKLITEGHKARLEFARRIKKHFGNDIDLFGRGIVEFKDKWEVLAPYRYSFAIENTSRKYYFTEKLTDCFLAHTFPLYHGCPNVDDYFSRESLMAIDIHDFSDAKKKIEKVISDDSHYRKAVPHLKEAKKKVLFEYNLFPVIVNFIEQNMRGVDANHFEQRRIASLVKKMPIRQRLMQLFKS